MDGIAASNTLWLERAANWKTICIEGSPGMYRDMVLRRPAALAVNAAVCDAISTVHWHEAGNVSAKCEQKQNPSSSNVDLLALPPPLLPLLHTGWGHLRVHGTKI